MNQVSFLPPILIIIIALSYLFKSAELDFHKLLHEDNKSRTKTY